MMMMMMMIIIIIIISVMIYRYVKNQMLNIDTNSLY